MKLTLFEKSILYKIKAIPRGRVSTYAEVARAVGRVGGIRGASAGKPAGGRRARTLSCAVLPGQRSGHDCRRADAHRSLRGG